MSPAQGLAFIQRHGVVLASAKGPVPNLADAVAGRPIRGSWWGHPKGHEIFRVLQTARSSPDVLVCRLVDGKITFVHRWLWPSLVRAHGHFPAKYLAQVREEHTSSGRHITHEIPFPQWAPTSVRAEAKAISESAALTNLGNWVIGA